MSLIRRILGTTLQQAFDLDREAGPRYLSGDAVYLFSDPLQNGLSVAEPKFFDKSGVTTSGADILAKPEEGHNILLKGFAVRFKNISGVERTFDARLLLRIDQPAAGDFMTMRVWGQEFTLADNEWEWVYMDQAPFLKDYLIPDGAELQFQVWGTSSSNIERVIRSYSLQVPKNVYLAK